MLRVVFDAEQKASEKLDEEFTIYSDPHKKIDYNLEVTHQKGSI